MTHYNLDTATLENNCNIIKDMIIGQLLFEGKISQEVYDEYREHYSVIIKPPSKFNAIWSKLTSHPDDDRFIIVRNVSMIPIETDDKPDNPKPGKGEKVINLFRDKDPA